MRFFFDGCAIYTPIAVKATSITGKRNDLIPTAEFDRKPNFQGYHFGPDMTVSVFNGTSRELWVQWRDGVVTPVEKANHYHHDEIVIVRVSHGGRTSEWDFQVPIPTQDQMGSDAFIQAFAHRKLQVENMVRSLRPEDRIPRDSFVIDYSYTLHDIMERQHGIYCPEVDICIGVGAIPTTVVHPQYPALLAHADKFGKHTDIFAQRTVVCNVEVIDNDFIGPSEYWVRSLGEVIPIIPRAVKGTPSGVYLRYVKKIPGEMDRYKFEEKRYDINTCLKRKGIFLSKTDAEQDAILEIEHQEKSLKLEAMRLNIQDAKDKIQERKTKLRYERDLLRHKMKMEIIAFAENRRKNNMSGRDDKIQLALNAVDMEFQSMLALNKANLERIKHKQDSRNDSIKLMLTSISMASTVLIGLSKIF